MFLGHFNVSWWTKIPPLVADKSPCACPRLRGPGHPHRTDASPWAAVCALLGLEHQLVPVSIDVCSPPFPPLLPAALRMSLTSPGHMLCTGSYVEPPGVHGGEQLTSPLEAGPEPWAALGLRRPAPSAGLAGLRLSL